LWATVIIAGGVLAGAYLFRVLGRMLAAPGAGFTTQSVGTGRQMIALGLSIVALLIGTLPLAPMAFLMIGRLP
jgi:hypothetical protein